jgi:sigma-B regulation protein RsbU (phosphoserine phosphatase)
MFLNIACYLAFSIALSQNDAEKEQAEKFVNVFKRKEDVPLENKRLSKPVTIVEFLNLMSKFIGEPQANAAISEFIGEREIDEQGGVSEFELPALRRFTEKTLAGALGAAAAGAVVESYLSDMGTRLEPVYDIYSKVRNELNESRENLYVRLRASEIMNRTLDLQIIMNELLELVGREFRFNLALIRIINEKGALTVCSHSGRDIPAITGREIVPDINSYVGDAFLSNKPLFVNDTAYLSKPDSKELIQREGIRSFAHIPIAREEEPPLGILSVYSTSIVGLFTPGFLDLLSSLAGQLAQAIKIDSEIKARELERREKELVLNEMEIAKQIQLSLLPANYPELEGVQFAGRCVPATHVGGDYYDFFPRGESAVDMVIADVSGHSVGAALIMAETRSALRAQTHLTSNAGEMLSELNELLHEDLGRAELFITMFYAKYDAVSRLLMYANAGHNPPLLFRPAEMSFSELDAEGLILGIKRDVDFEEKSISLQTGDLLLLYTDGIVEAQNEAGELFGVGRLCDVLAATHEKTPELIVESVLKEVMGFSCSPVLQDDISMLLMKLQSINTTPMGT